MIEGISLGPRVVRGAGSLGDQSRHRGTGRARGGQPDSEVEALRRTTAARTARRWSRLGRIPRSSTTSWPSSLATSMRPRGILRDPAGRPMEIIHKGAKAGRPPDTVRHGDVLHPVYAVFERCPLSRGRSLSPTTCVEKRHEVGVLRLPRRRKAGRTGTWSGGVA